MSQDASVEETMSRYRAAIEKRLSAALEGMRCDRSLRDAMAYALEGGKRLRGAILLSFCESLDGPFEAALSFAAAVEMIQAYSLVHDDLPCMDDDDFRRGKPSCHKAFGYATALLAGDALLTAAFEVAASSRSVEQARVVRGIAALSAAAGPSGMVGGQILDLAMEGQSVGAERVREMYALKTGAMFETSARLGMIIAGASKDVETAAARWGALFGYAYQVLDDIEDLDQSDREEKKDILARETSLESARREARDALESSLEALKSVNCLNPLAAALTGLYIEKA